MTPPFDIEAGRAEWSSFMPTLSAVLAETTGPVLEVGVGYYSTPFLHGYCQANHRRLTSVEEDYAWGRPVMKQWANDNHWFKLMPYDDIIPVLAREKWGVIFLDHSPGLRRGQDLSTLLGSTDFIVIHDYHLAIEDEIAPRLTWLHHHVHHTKPPTLVVSKFKEIPASVLSL